MGCVFSCFASTFMWTGELLEYVFLAVGEIGSVLVRGIFAVLIGLCDVLAAISCCWRVPYADRPDRTTYTYSTVATNVGNKSVLKLTSPEHREARKQEKEAAKKEKALQAESTAADRAEAAKKREAEAQAAKDKREAEKAEKEKEKAEETKAKEELKAKTAAEKEKAAAAKKEAAEAKAEEANEKTESK